MTLLPSTSHRRRPAGAQGQERGLVSATAHRRRGSRRTLQAVRILSVALLALVCVGPLLLMVKMAITPTTDTLNDPLSWFPSGQVQWGNFSRAWHVVQLNRYMVNTLVQAVGAAVLGCVVALTGAYVLSVLRPAWAPILRALVLLTLLVPATVTLVPLYLNAVHLPLLGVRLLNTPWAIWLPAAANAFSVLVVSRFMDQIPRELIEAARVDGASPWRVFVSVILPLSRPILGVVLIIQFVAAWKDYLWPLLAMPDPTAQPLSVAIPALTQRVEVNAQMAALTITVLVPIVVLLIFQRQVINAVGASGGIKE